MRALGRYWRVLNTWVTMDPYSESLLYEKFWEQLTGSLEGQDQRQADSPVSSLTNTQLRKHRWERIVSEEIISRDKSRVEGILSLQWQTGDGLGLEQREKFGQTSVSHWLGFWRRRWESRENFKDKSAWFHLTLPGCKVPEGHITRQSGQIVPTGAQASPVTSPSMSPVSRQEEAQEGENGEAISEPESLWIWWVIWTEYVSSQIHMLKP